MTVQKENKELSYKFFSDRRGEIFINKFKGTEFNVIFTNAGGYRAGDYHPTEQYNVVLKGKIKLTLRQKNKDISKQYGPNELIIIPPNTPHLYKFIIDTVMIEWFAGRYMARYYEPYRKIIKKQLGK
ncbi:MAG: cupin domain-containing protein [Patescibacteria group bacterium]